MSLPFKEENDQQNHVKKCEVRTSKNHDYCLALTGENDQTYAKKVKEGGNPVSLSSDNWYMQTNTNSWFSMKITQFIRINMGKWQQKRSFSIRQQQQQNNESTENTVFSSRLKYEIYGKHTQKRELLIDKIIHYDIILESFCIFHTNTNRPLINSICWYDCHNSTCMIFEKCFEWNHSINTHIGITVGSSPFRENFERQLDNIFHTNVS